MVRLSIIIAALAIIIALPEPGTIPGPLVRTNLQTPNTTDLDEPLYTRRTIGFPCSGVRCEAWLYLPKAAGAKKPPLVIIGHGMGGQRDTGLHKYSTYFADAGLAVFTFDYRTFGGSDGEPRHWVSPGRHIEDWRAAVDFVTGQGSDPAARDPHQQALLDAVDSDRIVLWGTSFGGGHALSIAPSLGPRIKAVIAQVPHLNATSATLQSVKSRGIPKSLRMLLLGLKDKARHALGLPPVYVPLAGPPGSMALMQLIEEDWTHYTATRPKQPQGGWRNMACARLSAELTLKKYSPIKFIGDIEAPVLLVASTQDQLCPFDQVQAAVRLAKRGSLISRDVSHFHLTSAKHLPSLMREQVAWLMEQLGLQEGGGAADRGAVHARAEHTAKAAAEASEGEAGAGEAVTE
ncbi:MAG: alpha/beta-hydrolase [Monoraphidium minutum]|nr:MAG: alpha/beta-hydrolase [Monoraphidium minutum]